MTCPLCNQPFYSASVEVRMTNGARDSSLDKVSLGCSNSCNAMPTKQPGEFKALLLAALIFVCEVAQEHPK
jgi:hypothetical protein